MDFLKTLLTNVETYPGSGTITWRGKDDFGNRLPQKAYVVAVSVNGKEREGVKVVGGRVYSQFCILYSVCTIGWAIEYFLFAMHWQY